MVGVVAPAVLLALGMMPVPWLARDIALRGLVEVMDGQGCESAPQTWGVTSGDFTVFAYDRDGKSANPSAPPLEDTLREGAQTTGALVRMPDQTPFVRAALRRAEGGPCAIVRLRGRAQQPRQLGRFYGALTLTMLAGMLAASAGAWWLVIGPFRRRVQRLAQAAERVGEPGFTTPESGGDALGHIGGVLTDSHGRIVSSQAALVDRNRALENHLAGIAHDLRTPLASMQLALEALSDEATGGLQSEARRALADAVYLSALVDNLHQGARLRHDIDVASGLVDLTELVERLSRRYAVLARHAGVDLATNVPDAPVWAACTPTLAERALANPIQNAIEHNRAGGHVAIVLSVSAEGFLVVVDDDGPGMPQHIAASLASESLRDDAARQRGPGLGLLITAEIARRAGWTLTTRRLDGGGTRVAFSGTVVPSPPAAPAEEEE